MLTRRLFLKGGGAALLTVGVGFVRRDPSRAVVVEPVADLGVPGEPRCARIVAVGALITSGGQARRVADAGIAVVVGVGAGGKDRRGGRDVRGVGRVRIALGRAGARRVRGGSGGSRRDDDRDDRFENLDVNRNGRVEKSEWHGSLDAFEWLDRNRDNVLSRTEVVGEASKQFDSFASLDTNRSGTLTPDEWKWTTRSFARYDTDRDGLLTRREFEAGGGAPDNE